MRDDMSTILDRARTLGAEHAERDIDAGRYPLGPDLSGEWADGLTPSSLARECGYEYPGPDAVRDEIDDHTEIADAYEEGYADMLSEMNVVSPVPSCVDVDGEHVAPDNLEASVVGVTLNEEGAYPRQAPLGWVNSARVIVSPEDDQVSVTISTGDPRGAFVMTVRRTGDGRLLLHVPHEGMSLPHEDIHEIRTGTFEVR